MYRAHAHTTLGSAVTYYYAPKNVAPQYGSCAMCHPARPQVEQAALLQEKLQGSAKVKCDQMISESEENDEEESNEKATVSSEGLNLH